MTRQDYDSIVIGAGSAGLAFATTAAGRGARIALIQRAELGGTCVNRGCVPKKIMWAAGQVLTRFGGAAARCIAGDARLDFAELVRTRDAKIEQIRESYEEKVADAGATLVRDEAEVSSASCVRVGGQDLTTGQVILATGAHPALLRIEGSAHLSDSGDVLSWRELPARIVIVGGGYIGCEFAAIFNAFGVDVTLVHGGPRILDNFDEALARHVQAGLEQSGVTVMTDDAVTAVMQNAGCLTYQLKSGNTGTADRVVAAIGRAPNTSCLGALADRLEVASSGALEVDAGLQTSVPGVYAIGDAADRLPLTPVATADGTALAHMLHGQGGTLVDLNLVATTTFVYPPAAFVGAVGQGEVREGCATPLSDSVLAPSEAQASDLYRIGVDPQTRALTGVQLVADGAEDMIALAAALVAARAPAETLAQATPIHPSFAEEFFRDQ